MKKNETIKEVKEEIFSLNEQYCEIIGVPIESQPEIIANTLTDAISIRDSFKETIQTIKNLADNINYYSKDKNYFTVKATRKRIDKLHKEFEEAADKYYDTIRKPQPAADEELDVFFCAKKLRKKYNAWNSILDVPDWEISNTDLEKLLNLEDLLLLEQFLADMIDSYNKGINRYKKYVEKIDEIIKQKARQFIARNL